MRLFFVFLLIVINATLPIQSQLRIKAVGDVMPGSYTPNVRIPSDSGKVMIESIGDYLKNADLRIGNFEGAFVKEGIKPNKCSESSRKKNECFEFGVPEYLAKMLPEMGFNAMTFDNNHCNDYGSSGYLNTLYVFDEIGIPIAGQRMPISFKIKNKKIALVAFGFDKNSYKITNLDQTSQVIQQLKKESDIVIVSFHGGAEGKKALYIADSTEYFLGGNRGNVIQFARTAIDAGADFVFGHSPHVLRAVELYKGKLIAYSMGNFLTYGHFNLSGVNGITAILDVTIDESNGNFLSGKIIPFKQKKPGIPYFDTEGEAIELMQKLVSAYKDANLIIDDSGEIIKK